MLKANSKKAKSNLCNYIAANFTGENYDLTPTTDIHLIAQYILDAFETEKFYSYEQAVRLNMSRLDVFEDWCRGLPSILDCGFVYNRSAIKDLGDILEESEDERNRFTEEQAEKLLIHLIFRTLSTLTSR